MSLHITCIALRVQNLERSVAFYEQGLDMHVRREFAREGLRMRWSILRWFNHPAKVQLVEEDGSPITGNALYYLVVIVDDLPMTFAKVVAAGGTILKPIGPDELLPHVTNALIADPDGHRIELVERKSSPLMSFLTGRLLPPGLVELVSRTRHAMRRKKAAPSR